MMQQTETYKLNLIETSDTFSPNPLNENMEKVEAALGGVRAEASADTAALDQRVTVLEAHKFVWGGYVGDGAIYEIDLGFTPGVALVFPSAYSSPIYGMAIEGYPAGGGLTIIDGGIRVSGSFIASGKKFVYLAIA